MLRRSVVIGLLIFVFGGLLFAQVSEMPNGSGTEENPYEIANLNNLLWVYVTNTPHTYYVQTADIDAAETRAWNDSCGWPGIGNQYHPFKGNYDGQTFNIDSLYMNWVESSYIGLFGHTDSSIIKNVNIRNCNITGKYFTAGLIGSAGVTDISGCTASGSVSGWGTVGVLLGEVSYGTVDRCHSSGSVSATKLYSGGLVGYVYRATVSQSYTTASISSTKGAGGFMGYGSYSTTLNCFSTGSVIVNESGAGGFVYGSTYLNAYFCYSTGEVTDPDTPSGFDDTSLYPKFTQCFWDTESSGIVTSATMDSRGAVGKTTLEMQTKSTFEDAGWSFTHRWDINGSYPVLKQLSNVPTAWEPAAGDGSEGDPYQISSLNNLYWITQDKSRWSLHYKQMCDINALNTGAMVFGFLPIGDENIQFSGSYDGQGYEISNLLIDRVPDDYIGLFGCADGATIDNVHLNDCVISGEYFVGGLIGLANDCEVSECSAHGFRLACGKLGGLIGTTNINTTIDKCHSSGTVLASEFNANYSGGLVGMNSNSAITQSYSTISVFTYEKAGGFVGATINSTILDCYCTGSVSASNNGAGGFVYYSQDSDFENCYSTGEVTDSDTPSGFIDDVYSNTTITACFWDIEASGAVSSEGATSKITLEMQTQSTFVDSAWDFVSVWLMDSRINSGYPVFLWQIDPVVPEISTLEVINVDTCSAMIQYRIAEVGLPRAYQHGACWSTSGMPDLDSSMTDEGQVDSSGIYLSVISGLEANTEYIVRPYVISRNDTIYGKNLSFSTLETSIYDVIPMEFTLDQNYPNPFNPITTISFAVPEAEHVKLQIFDMAGRFISTLVDECKEAGYWDVKWNASDFSSGLYIYRVEYGGHHISKKMVLMK